MLSLASVKKLKEKKHRAELGYFLLEGPHLVQELIKALPLNAALNQAQLFYTQDYELGSTALQSELISPAQLAKITDTKTPQGVVAAVPFFNVQPSSTSKQIYLHEVQDPGNLGNIIRTLAWFGGFELLLSPSSVDPFSPKVVRASMGGVFHVPIQTGVELAALKGSKAALGMSGSSVTDAEFKDFDCYVFGNEARGLPTDLHAKTFSIQGAGHIESLNLAQAVGVCAFCLQ